MGKASDGGDQGIFASGQHDAAGQHGGGGNQGIFSSGQSDAPKPDVSTEQVHNTAGDYNVDLAQDVATTQDEARVAAERAANSLLPFGELTNWIGQVTGQYDLREPTVAELSKGQEYKYPVPAPQQINYMSISHKDLYQSVHDADPGQVEGTGQMWAKVGNHSVDMQTKILKGISASESGWTGNAADIARHSVAQMARKSGEIAHGSHLAGATLSQQSNALSKARRDMEPPPENPYDPQQAAARLESLKNDPVAYHKQLASDYTQQQHEHDLHVKAAKVAHTYDATTGQLAQEQPAFAPPPKPTSGHEMSGKTGGYDSTQGHGRSLPPDPGQSNTTGTSTSGYTPGGTDQTGQGWRGAPQPGGTTGTDTAGLGRQTSPGGPGLNGIPGVGGQLGNGTRHRQGPEGVPMSGMLRGTGGGAGGETTRGGFRRGPGGSLAGEGSGGTGRGTGAGTRGTGEQPGTGKRAEPGARSAARAAEGAVPARGSTPRGAASERGMGGRPMTGGRGKGGKGEDDYEHETPDFLEGPDDEFWSTQEKVAPPVIGDWHGQYDPTKPASYNPDRDG